MKTKFENALSNDKLLWKGARLETQQRHELSCSVLHHFSRSLQASVGTILLTKQRHFFVIKPTSCSNFTNLFWHETLHEFQLGPAQKLSTNLYDIYHC